MDRFDLLFESEQLFRLIGKKFKLQVNDLLSGELTFAEFLFLKHLYEVGPSRSSDISSTFSVTLSHITTLTDRLIKRGLIYRNRGLKEDRRAIAIGLTDEGKETVEKYKRLVKNYALHLFDEITDEELVQLKGILTKLSNKME